MRVLLETECGAVAGGHKSTCEQAVTTTFIVAGAIGGAVVGNLPGALVGAGIGAYAADATAPYICAEIEKSRQEKEEEAALEEERDALFEQQYVNWSQGTGSDDFEVTGPHHLVVNTNS